MWDLKVIVALNEVAAELEREGKNPNQAMAELARRAKERRERAASSESSESSQADGDNGEK